MPRPSRPANARPAAPRAPSQGRTLDAAVRRINRVSRNMGVQRQLAIAKVVLQICYSGDLDAWRQKRPGSVSIRALASHKNLRMNAGGLSRAIGVLELNERMPLKDLPNVTVSHLFEVIPLPAERQAALLADVNTQALSVRALRKKLRAEANPDADDTHAEPEVNDNPPVATAVRRLRRELRKPETKASLAAMSDGKRERLDEMVVEVLSGLGALRPFLLGARRTA